MLCAEEIISKVLSLAAEEVHDFFSPSGNPHAFHLSMGHKIRNINRSLDHTYKESSEIGLGMVELISSTVDPKEIRLNHPYVDELKVVGSNKDMSNIVEYVT